MFVMLLFYSNQVRVTDMYVNRLSLLKVLLSFKDLIKTSPPQPLPPKRRKTLGKEYTNYFLLLHASNK